MSCDCVIVCGDLDACASVAWTFVSGDYGCVCCNTKMTRHAGRPPIKGEKWVATKVRAFALCCALLALCGAAREGKEGGIAVV